MRLLVLGGTQFLGRHVVDAALAAGHHVTLFNRGRTNPELYREVVRLVGDRGGDLSALAGGEWDACIDTCGYFPRHVTASAGLLSGAVGHYTFVSSISVYADTSEPGIDESAPLARLPAGTDVDALDEVTGENYGPLKALCEEAAEAAMPGRVANVRPGLIVGPYDPSDRFTYWVRRLAEGGAVLAPDRRDMPVQVIDGRDLGEWLVRVAVDATTGVFNVTGPVLRFDEILETCRAVAGVDAEIVWVDEAFLLEAGVAPWMGLPLWLPADAGRGGLMAADVRAARTAGLTTRPLADTCTATLAWDRTRAGEGMGAQLARPREAELLEAWRALSP